MIYLLNSTQLLNGTLCTYDFCIHLKYEAMARFEIKESHTTPRLSLGLEPKIFKLGELLEIYPEIRQKNAYIEDLKMRNNKKLELIGSKYLAKLLTRNDSHVSDDLGILESIFENIKTYFNDS